MSQDIRNIGQTKKQNRFMSCLYMVLLGLYPLLAWYDASLPMGLGAMILLLLSVYVLILNRNIQTVVPKSFWLLYIYVCVLWSYRYNFAIWTILPPGGWVFFSFCLSVFAGTITYDYHTLKKTMRWVLVIAISLFWVQYILLETTGSQQFCFVPNLTEHFTYQGLSYSQLANRHLSSGFPCSIFLEKSYMAYYAIAYMTMLLFDNNAKSKLLTRDFVIISLTLFFLRSGSGIIGLIVLIIAKLIVTYWRANGKIQFFIFFLLVPTLIGITFILQYTDFGQELFSRQAELSTEGTSGYNRIINGYMFFDQMSSTEKIIGMDISTARNLFGLSIADGSLVFYINGVQTILISLGFVGAFLYFVFYFNLFKRIQLSARMCIIALLVMGLLESNYLNAYMVLLTTIPCGNWYQKRKLV